MRALVVDPDAQRRQRLQTELLKSAICSSVRSHSGLEAALQELRADAQLELIFVAERLPAAGILSFQTQVSEFPDADRALRILVCSPDSGLGAEETPENLLGCDLSLSEPFDSRKLFNLISLTKDVLSWRLDRRIRRAIELLVNELADQVDLLAKLREQNNSGALSQRILNEMGSVLPALPEEYRAYYFECCTRIFGVRSPAKKQRRQTGSTALPQRTTIAELTRLLKNRAA